MPSTKGPYPSVNRCPKISKEQSLEIPFSPSIHPPTHPSLPPSLLFLGICKSPIMFL